jgi:aminopeptidase N
MRRSLGSCVLLAGWLGACEDDPIRWGEIASSPSQGEYEPGAQDEASAFIAHYDYRFDVVSRVAHATLTAVLETPGNCISFPLRAEGADPRTARVDGAPATAGSSRDGTTLRLCGKHVREAGEQLVLDVDLVVPLRTLGGSQIGYSVTRDEEQNPFHYLTSWVGDCDRLGPCDPRPGRFAKYTFRVTHPETLLVRCPGSITEVSPTETVCDFAHEGGPTYSTFGVAAYPAAAWARIDKGQWGSARVTLYDRPQTMISAKIDPAYHAGFVSFMESMFGPYPFGDELRILTAPTYWSGFEHPGNIVLSDRLARGWSVYLRPVAHVLDHEIAHMWAGNETTLAGTYDFVWKEAMAEYLTYVYESMTEPAAGETTARAWKLLSYRAAHFPVPGEQPALFDYYGDVYGPGPMVLFRQLEVLTSRAQVLEALRSVLGKPRTLSMEELLAALEAHTGLDLDEYAAAWIRGTGAPEWPRVALTYHPGDATDFLGVRLTAGRSRRCKFHVALRGASPGELQLVSVDTLRDGTDQTIAIQPQPSFSVVALDLDPLQECLVLPSTAASAAPAARIHPWQSFAW